MHAQVVAKMVFQDSRILLPETPQRHGFRHPNSRALIREYHHTTTTLRHHIISPNAHLEGIPGILLVAYCTTRAQYLHKRVPKQVLFLGYLLLFYAYYLRMVGGNLCIYNYSIPTKYQNDMHSDTVSDMLSVHPNSTTYCNTTTSYHTTTCPFGGDSWYSTSSVLYNTVPELHQNCTHFRGEIALFITTYCMLSPDGRWESMHLQLEHTNQVLEEHVFRHAFRHAICTPQFTYSQRTTQRVLPRYRTTTCCITLHSQYSTSRVLQNTAPELYQNCTRNTPVLGGKYYCLLLRIACYLRMVDGNLCMHSQNTASKYQNDTHSDTHYDMLIRHCNSHLVEHSTTLSYHYMLSHLRIWYIHGNSTAQHLLITQHIMHQNSTYFRTE